MDHWGESQSALAGGRFELPTCWFTVKHANHQTMMGRMISEPQTQNLLPYYGPTTQNLSVMTVTIILSRNSKPWKMDFFTCLITIKWINHKVKKKKIHAGFPAGPFSFSFFVGGGGNLPLLPLKTVTGTSPKQFFHVFKVPNFGFVGCWSIALWPTPPPPSHSTPPPKKRWNPRENFDWSLYDFARKCSRIFLPPPPPPGAVWASAYWYNLTWH